MILESSEWCRCNFWMKMMMKIVRENRVILEQKR